MEKEKKVSKLKAMAGKKITAEDIFTNHYQIWAFIPLFLYLLTPVVHMIVYSILYSDEMTIEELNHFLNTSEKPGDNYISIVQLTIAVGTLAAIVALVSYLAYKKQHHLRRYPDNVPIFFFIAYIVLIIVSTIVNKTSFNRIAGFTMKGEGIFILVAYYVVYYFCGSLINREKYKRLIIYLFLITGFMIGILTIIDFFGVDVKIIGDTGVCGIFYHFNFYAYYLSITIPLCAALILLDKYLAGRIFAFILFVMNTFILAINDSMGGFLASAVALIFLIVAVSIKNKKFSFFGLGLIALFIGIIFVTGLFYQSFFSEIVNLGSDVKKIVTNSEDAAEAGTERWDLWTHTAQYIRERPLFGWGYEGTWDRLGAETNSHKAHNEYLENMAYFGIPAGILYLAALISVYVKAFIRRHNIDSMTICCLAAALGYIGSALVGNSFIFIAPFCFIFLGLANQTIPAADNFTEESKENTEENSNDNIEENIEGITEENIEGITEEKIEENAESVIQ